MLHREDSSARWATGRCHRARGRQGQGASAGLRPPLTAAARDGRVDRERDGGMSRVFREQRNDESFARDALTSDIWLAS